MVEFRNDINFDEKDNDELVRALDIITETMGKLDEIRKYLEANLSV